MLLDAIIEPISDISTIAAQSVVDSIAARSSLARDGWLLTGLRVIVAGVVFLVIGVGGAALVVAFIWWLGLKLLFGGLFT